MIYAFTPQSTSEALTALHNWRRRGWGLFDDDMGRSVLIAHATRKGQLVAPKDIAEQADLVLCCHPQAVAERLGVNVVARDVNAPVGIGFSQRTGNVLVRVPKA